MSVTGKRMRKNPHGWMLAAVLLLAAAGLLAVHSHQTAAVPPAEPAQEEPSVTVIPAEPELPEEPVEEEPVPEEPWGPVAESAPVDDSYFDDVAFVGDSRTDGFRLYSGLNRGTYFCVTGETVASATELENWKGENGKKVSLAEAVAAADCGKIYLMLGVNELGRKMSVPFQPCGKPDSPTEGGPSRRGTGDSVSAAGLGGTGLWGWSQLNQPDALIQRIQLSVMPLPQSLESGELAKLDVKDKALLAQDRTIAASQMQLEQLNKLPARWPLEQGYRQLRLMPCGRIILRSGR